MRHTRWSLSAVCAAALLLSACAKSYVLVSFGHPGELAAEATATPLATAMPAIRKVAVRAPAGCARDAAPATGAGGLAVRSRAILESRCDAWLSELEKALAARYEVVGWRELAQGERADRAGSGRAAGADLVLVVTELHAEPLLVSAAERAAVRLARATPRGDPAPGEPLSPDEDAAIRRLVAARYPDGALVGVRAALEISAVPAAGGEPLFTYRAQVSDALAGALDQRMLLRGRAGSWRPVVPRGWRPEAPPAAPPARAASPESSPGSSAESSASAPPAPASSAESSASAPAPAAPAEDPVRARIRELAAAVAADLVATFPTAG